MSHSNVYLAAMYRYGDRDLHSYVLGAYSTEAGAVRAGEQERAQRGGKYEAEVLELPVDGAGMRIVVPLGVQG